MFLLFNCFSLFGIPNASSEAGCKGSKDFRPCKGGTGYFLDKMLSDCFTGRKKMEETLLYTTSLLQTELASLIHYNNELTANKSLILNVR